MRTIALVLLMMLAVPAFAAEPQEVRVHKTLAWDDLMPEGEWERYDELYKSLFDVANIEEGSQADSMTQIGTFATVAALDGQKVRLPGFALPLEYVESREVSEFLLVPYFGACIHAPPPPPNQIVYVTSATPVTLGDLNQPIWARGTLRAKKNENDLGSAAYTLELDGWEIYKGPVE